MPKIFLFLMLKMIETNQTIITKLKYWRIMKRNILELCNIVEKFGFAVSLNF